MLMKLYSNLQLGAQSKVCFERLMLNVRLLILFCQLSKGFHFLQEKR